MKNINNKYEKYLSYFIDSKIFNNKVEFKKILIKLSKINSKPIFLFKLIINNKKNIRIQLNDINKLRKEIEKEFNDFFDLDFYSAIQIKLESFDNANIGLINNLRNDFDLLIGMGGLNKENRFFLENTRIDFLLDPQNSFKKSKIDFIHHFNSGINQVLSKFAKEKNIGFIFNMNFTEYFTPYLIAKEIGRINQNIKFARKYGFPIIITKIISNEFQIKDRIQLTGIASIFNISTKQKGEVLFNLYDRILLNRKYLDNSYINEYIEIIE